MTMRDMTASANADANGDAEIVVQPSGGQDWTVHQVTPEATNAGGSATGALRKNGALVSPFLATGDVIADSPPLRLLKGDRMQVRWAGLTSGDLVSIFVIYDDGTTV